MRFAIQLIEIFLVAVNMETFVKLIFVFFTASHSFRVSQLTLHISCRIAITPESFTLIWWRDKCSQFAKQADPFHIESVPNTWTHTINKRSHELPSQNFVVSILLRFFGTKEYHNRMVLWVPLPLLLWWWPMPSHSLHKRIIQPNSAYVVEQFTQLMNTHRHTHTHLLIWWLRPIS